MSLAIRQSYLAAAVWVLCMAPVEAQMATETQSSTSTQIQQAQKLNAEGKQDAALEIYNQILEATPNQADALIGAGIALDLKGNYDDARQQLQKAIENASGDTKVRALRAMAMSYGFTRQPDESAKYEQQVFDLRLSKQDFTGAAEIANELGRVYLESDDLDNAFKWYQTGYETALRKANLKDTEKNLWLFRWEHAQARIAVRRKQRAETEKHVAAAKTALDNAENPDQARFFPYLTGYVAYYRGNYKLAIKDFLTADQRDPFILAMLAQSYEKAGQRTKAREYYRKVLESNAHNPTNAYARPLAKEKLGMSK